MVQVIITAGWRQDALRPRKRSNKQVVYTSSLQGLLAVNSAFRQSGLKDYRQHHQALTSRLQKIKSPKSEDDFVYTRQEVIPSW